MKQLPTFSAAVCLAAAAIILTPAAASATALTLDDPASALAPLHDLQVQGSVDEAAASLIEARRYAVPGESGTTVTTRFHRSLDADNSTVQGVAVDGLSVGFEVLRPVDADARRFALVASLGDPAPLRELGQAMVLTDAMEVPAGGAMTVEVTLTLPLRRRGTMQGLTIPTDWNREPGKHFTVALDVVTESPLRALYSPYHQLAITRDGQRGAQASYSAWQPCTTFDITVLLSSGGGPVHVDLLPYRYSEADGGFFLALLSSEQQAEETVVLPRDLVILLDVSGSMDGQKITQARLALQEVLSALRPADNFAVIAFHSSVASSRPAAVAATPENLADARAFVDDLRADGGTNVSAGLASAFDSLPINPGHTRQIVLLTDGVPTEGEVDTDAILAAVAARNEVAARIFAFGIGFDVNTVLLDRLAKETGGAAFYIQSDAAVASAVGAFFAETADPILADPTLDLSDFGVSATQPSVLQDLYAGGTAVVAGRYSTPGQGTIVLSGSRGGQAWSQEFEVTLPEVAITESYVPRIWATRRVGGLLHEVKLGNDDPTLVEDAIALATRFGVVTDFTWFAIDEDGNMTMTYSEVPIEEVGSVAVATSSSLDDYSTGSTLDGGPDTVVPYVWDRVLPIRDGAATDTSVPSAPQWVDLHFGSPTYLQVAREPGVAPFLAARREVRFEHLGRSFRVSDPAAPPAGGLPAETTSIPRANGALPAVEDAEIEAVGGPAVGGPVSVPGGPSEDSPVSGARVACQGGTGTDGSAPWFAMAIVLIALRRRRG